jgi:hypothetical protein
MKYEFHPEAEQEFLEAATRYERERYRGSGSDSEQRCFESSSCYSKIRTLARTSRVTSGTSY